MRIRFQSGLEQNKQEGLAEPNAYSTPRQGGGQKKKALRLGLHSDLIFLTSCLKHQGQELPSPVHRKTAPSCSHRPKENKPHTESTPSSTAPFSLLLSFSLPFIIHLSLPPSLSSLSLPLSVTQSYTNIRSIMLSCCKHQMGDSLRSGCRAVCGSV